MFEWLDDMDLYIQPSLQEGLPRAVVEAMSRGLPALGAHTGGIPELLGEDCIFPRKGVDAIAELLTALKPEQMIAMAAREAIRRMVVPSVLALLIPVIGGFLLGPEFVGGILVGATIVAIPRAIFMGNSGGAFDNAKKYIEQGMLKGHAKGSPAHKAAVTGDTIGDTRKDVVGVALDIFIKLMSTVANTITPIISRYHIFK